MSVRQAVCHQFSLLFAFIYPALHHRENPGATFSRIIFPVGVWIRVCHGNSLAQDSEVLRGGETLFQTAEARFLEASFCAKLLGTLASGLWEPSSTPSMSGLHRRAQQAPWPVLPALTSLQGSLWFPSSLENPRWVLFFSWILTENTWKIFLFCNCVYFPHRGPLCTGRHPWHFFQIIWNLYLHHKIAVFLYCLLVAAHHFYFSLKNLDFYFQFEP